MPKKKKKTIWHKRKGSFIDSHADKPFHGQLKDPKKPTTPSEGKLQKILNFKKSLKSKIRKALDEK